MDDQQGPTAHSTGDSVSEWQPGWEGSVGEEDGTFGWAEPLRCAPETITTLSTGYLSSNIKQKVKKQPTNNQPNKKTQETT